MATTGLSMALGKFQNMESGVASKGAALIQMTKTGCRTVVVESLSVMSGVKTLAAFS
jgi:hypothetical protein